MGRQHVQSKHAVLGLRVNSLGMLRSAVLATASAWVLLPQASLAQSPAQSGAQNIPSVTVTAPEARRRAAPSVQRRAPRSSEQTANRSKPQPQRNVGFVETPLGPVHGYVAGRSSSGTKTNTPDRKSTRLNSSHVEISYAVFCLKKKT